MSKLWEHAQSLWWLIIQDTPFYLYAIRLDINHGGVYECVRAVMRLQGKKIGKSVETQVTIYGLFGPFGSHLLSITLLFKVALSPIY